MIYDKCYSTKNDKLIHAINMLLEFKDILIVHTKEKRESSFFSFINDKFYFKKPCNCHRFKINRGD